MSVVCDVMNWIFVYETRKCRKNVLISIVIETFGILPNIPEGHTPEHEDVDSYCCTNVRTCPVSLV